MGDVTNLQDAKSQLRKIINKANINTGWVLVALPDDGPIAVTAYDQLSLSQVVTTLACGQSIVVHDILWGSDDDDEPAA